MISSLLIPLLMGIFLAINMGASGTAPSFSAAYGANLIRRSLIPLFFGIFVILGGVLAGQKVVLTLSGGLVPEKVMTQTMTTTVLFSISLALLIANLLKIPQSTSQATVLSIAGMATYLKVLNLHKLFVEIIPAWFILPIISLAITLVVGKIIYPPFKRRFWWRFDKLASHPSLKLIVLLSCFYIAFAIGSNNVANTAGPIAAMLSNELKISPQDSRFSILMIMTTIMAAPWFGIGSSLLGHGVVQTTGKELTEFGPLGATLIALITASLLLYTSVFKGIPASLVQVNTFSIIGLGITKFGLKNTLAKTSVSKLVAVWVISPLIAFTLSYLLTAVVSH